MTQPAEDDPKQDWDAGQEGWHERIPQPKVKVTVGQWLIENANG